jgi:TRAP-type uncharacterized transport system substrate-binding protein
MRQFNGPAERKGLRPHHLVWSGARSLAPVLAPFLVSLAFILFYCGSNIYRGVACIRDSHLILASGPKTRSELGSQGRRIFYPYELGEQISRVVHRNCGDRPRWWSLDFWVNPDAQNRMRVENRPSAGTRDSIVRLFKRHRDPNHIDLAILQDGLIVDEELRKLDEAEPDRIQALAHLYRSVFCVFRRRDAPYDTLGGMRGRNVPAYLGQQGSGARYLTQRVLADAHVECRDVHPDWSPDRVARAMTSDSPEGNAFEVAFVLDKADSGVIRTFVESGRYDLVSVDGVDDLFRADEVFRSSTTMKPLTLARGSLSEKQSLPSRVVTTMETQTILACSADLPDWDAYQLTRTLNEHFRELGLGAEAAAQVPQSDPGSSFDYQIHEGAARYYRRGVAAESFPYQVLVVAIGASVALIAYWNAIVLKRRADRIARRIDSVLLRHRDDPAHAARELGALKVRAVLDYKDGRLNKEGLERIFEYLKLTDFWPAAHAHRDAAAEPAALEPVGAAGGR